jgi:DNA-binding CsgD family transcriptional regulator
MTNSITSFEQLLIEQSSLITCDPDNFEKHWNRLASQALDWFKLDRMCLYQNDKSLGEEATSTDTELKFINVASKGPNTIDNALISVDSLEIQGYLKMLHAQIPIHFSAQQLRTQKNGVLSTLYKNGVRWHTILPLKIHGKKWGALSMSRFGEDAQPLTHNQLILIKLLAEMWAVYWQFSKLSRHLSSKVTPNNAASLLSPRQKEVLSLLATGMTAKECAKALTLSHRTIESHKYLMLNVLNLSSQTDLIKFAVQNGLVAHHYQSGISHH